MGVGVFFNDTATTEIYTLSLHDALPIYGNVGIGTDSPKALIDLTVDQGKTVAGGVTFAQLGKTNEAANYASLQCILKGGASASERKWEFQTQEQGVANLGSIVFQPNGGKVVIGSGPLGLLEVNGDLTVSNGDASINGGLRSEEHTSELQSRRNLVCRLLLEKKKRLNSSHYV